MKISEYSDKEVLLELVNRKAILISNSFVELNPNKEYEELNIMGTIFYFNKHGMIQFCKKSQ